MQSEQESKSEQVPPHFPQQSPQKKRSQEDYPLVPSPPQLPSEHTLLTPTQLITYPDDDDVPLLLQSKKTGPDDDDNSSSNFVVDKGGKKRRLNRHCIKCFEVLKGANQVCTCLSCAKCCESVDCRAESHKSFKKGAREGAQRKPNYR